MEIPTQISQRYTPNVNVNSPISSSNNVNVKRLEDVQMTAEKLVQRFSAEHNRPYYHKVAWNLPEHVIWKLADQAIDGTHSKGDPKRLFYWLTQQYMKKAPASR